MRPHIGLICCQLSTVAFYLRNLTDIVLKEYVKVPYFSEFDFVWPWAMGSANAENILLGTAEESSWSYLKICIVVLSLVQ